jgi:hypothetical protein
VTGDDIDQTLADTLAVIVRLAKAGAMISLKKSTVCGIEGKVLGHRWQSGGMFNPEPKGLKALLDIPNDEMGKIPVASIYGLLSFFRPYIADFAPRTEPLRKLLAEAAPPWSLEHSKLVKEVV